MADRRPRGHSHARPRASVPPQPTTARPARPRGQKRPLSPCSNLSLRISCDPTHRSSASANVNPFYREEAGWDSIPARARPITLSVEERRTTTARVIPVAERQPGEPVSPELVLVCPELGRPVDDAEQAVTPTLSTTGPDGLLRPSYLRAPAPEGERARVGPRPNVGSRDATPPPVARRGGSFHITSSALVVVAMAALGILTWRSVSPIVATERPVAAPSVLSPSRNARAPVANAKDAASSPRAESVTPSERAGDAGGGARPSTIPTPRAAPPQSTVHGSRVAPPTRSPRPARRAGAKHGHTAEVVPSGILVRAPTGPLFSPDAGQRVVERPQLAWDPVANVRGYRLELYRGTRLILDVVALEPKVTLAARWRFGSRHIELTPGTYRWYVWVTPRTTPSHAERLLKASSFVLIRRSPRA